jgi:hypothetical protein
MAAIKWEQAEWFDKWFKDRTGLDPQSTFGKQARADFLAGELVWIVKPKPRKKKKK